MEWQPLVCDATLIEQARAGNQHAFGELAGRHSSRIYGVSFRILKNREDAEDNLQNVLCRAFNRISQFQGKSQFSTWLVRIAINEALMMLRKHRSEDKTRRPEGVEPHSSPEAREDVRDWHADPERQYITKELAAKALDGLHPTLRYTFILHKGEGWTNRELASALGIRAETVKSRVFRARVRLRQQIHAITKTKSVALQA
ncbi:MAG: sigma-70 family RNA polymerase sigma factor [Candidatus Acidiferrum sp.]|jgi:RNA polymerase sigma-70 factor (ECF subfamily)